MYVACLRNYRAQIAHLVAHHSKVALIGAGSRGQFREEDQLCCAWIAEGLLAAGYEPQNEQTLTIVKRWSGMPVESITASASATYLRNTGQTKDLDFILAHVDDLSEIYRFERNQIIKHVEELLLA
jgi:2-phosphosulfolactate phosphatase